LIPIATLADLPIPLNLAPMEATLVDDLPAGPGWRYEPKWDGFRCLAFRAGDKVELKAKSGKSLGRFFPDMVEVLQALPVDRFVIDGELIIAVAGSSRSTPCRPGCIPPRAGCAGWPPSIPRASSCSTA
jgi:ATP-dependent DNA ligase